MQCVDALAEQLYRREKGLHTDIDDCDECYAAVKISSHAADEAQSIPGELCEEFGPMGIHIYDDLIEIIGERDEDCLPFVNVCLRTWMEHLRDDADIWADMSPLNFDKWLLDKLAEPQTEQHGCTTSYELVMATFGSSQGKEESTPPRNAQITSNNATIIPTTMANTASSPSSDRMSKLQKVGDSVRQRLVKSHYFRGKKNSLRRGPLLKLKLPLPKRVKVN